MALKIIPTVRQIYCEALFRVVELDSAQFTAMAQAGGGWGTANLMLLFYVKCPYIRKRQRSHFVCSRKSATLLYILKKCSIEATRIFIQQE